MSDMIVKRERIEVPAIPEPTEYLERAMEIEASLAAITILTSRDYGRVDAYRKEAVLAEKTLVDVVFKPSREWARDLHMRITRLQNDTYIAVLKRVQRLAIEKMQIYDQDQLKIADLEAEQLRLEAEARLRMEREALGATLDALGDTKAAIALRDEPIPEITVEVPKLRSTVSANSYRDHWTAVVDDIKKIPREFMVVNQKALDSLAQSSKGRGEVPGVHFVNHPVFSGRGK